MESDHMQNLGFRNSIAIKDQEKIDAVKGQTFLMKVKSQGPCFILTAVAAQSTESMDVPPPFVNTINGGLITNYVICASGCFCVMKGLRNLSTPFMIFQGTEKEKGRY